MDKITTKAKIREAILNQVKPFHNEDIIFRLDSISDDGKFIIDVLDELLRENLVDYVEDSTYGWCWKVIK